MGKNPEAADNRWLREAYENRVPVIYFDDNAYLGGNMAEERVQRRLAAILAADGVG